MALLEKAAAQGEPEAMATLAAGYWDLTVSRNRFLKLLRESAELGLYSSQCEYADEGCSTNTAEQVKWLRREAMQSGTDVEILIIVHSARSQLKLFERGIPNEEVVFEIGDVLAGSKNWRLVSNEASDTAAGERILFLYEQWKRAALKAVLCWLWLSRGLGVAKDIRVLIAD